MTGTEYRAQHGDPATWTDVEYEQYGLVATPGKPVPAEVLTFLKQPPATRIEDRPDGSRVFHITPTA